MDKPRWEFLWQPAEAGPNDAMNVRIYRGSFKQACDRMLRWVEKQDTEIHIDYEAHGYHVPENAPHEKQFPDLTNIKHGLSEHVK